MLSKLIRIACVCILKKGVEYDGVNNKLFCKIV